jgi:hypothetical protein
MGSKIITEKDFFICKGGLMPAPMQSTQLITKKKDGSKYITIKDTSTQSYVDFACSKLMWLMALIAAIVAVAVVATGGMALIAIGAIAGAAGAVYGAVLGSLICGQKAAVARQWLGHKSNFMIMNTPTVTGDHKMLCSIFGMEISYAANIKNWWQAVSLGAANFIGEVLQGAMIGASVGMGGALIKGGISILSGGGGASGLLRGAAQIFKSLPGNFVGNIIQSFGKFGLGLRGVMGAQHTMQAYGETGEAGAADFGKGVFAMETGAYDSAKKIFSGQGSAMDFIGMILMFSPVGKATKERPGGGTHADEMSRNADGERAGKADDAEAAEAAPRAEGEAPANENTRRDGEAFEDPAPLDNATTGALGERAVVDRLRADGYTEVLQIQNNSGHGVDVIARNPTNGHVKCVEVKANSSKLSDAQKLGGEVYVNDRLNRAVNGERGYGVPPNPTELPQNARTAQRWIDEAPNVDYEVHRVPVDRTTGDIGTPDVTPWDPVPSN